MNPELDAMRRRVLLAGASAVGLALIDPKLVMAARAVGPKLQQTDARYGSVDRLADLVIPATDTPGGAAAAAAAFVLLALDRHIGDMQPVMLDRVRSALDAAAKADFFSLPRAHQETVLAEFDRAAYTGRPEPGSVQHDWRRIKLAILVGYYTSEIGASHELIYDPVPGGTTYEKVTSDFRSSVYDGMGGVLGGF